MNRFILAAFFCFSVFFISSHLYANENVSLAQNVLSEQEVVDFELNSIDSKGSIFLLVKSIIGAGLKDCGANAGQCITTCLPNVGKGFVLGLPLLGKDMVDFYKLMFKGSTTGGDGNFGEAMSSLTALVSNPEEWMKTHGKEIQAVMSNIDFSGWMKRIHDDLEKGLTGFSKLPIKERTSIVCMIFGKFLFAATVVLPLAIGIAYGVKHATPYQLKEGAQQFLNYAIKYINVLLKSGFSTTKGIQALLSNQKFVKWASVAIASVATAGVSINLIALDDAIYNQTGNFIRLNLQKMFALTKEDSQALINKVSNEMLAKLKENGDEFAIIYLNIARCTLGAVYFDRFNEEPVFGNLHNHPNYVDETFIHVKEFLHSQWERVIDKTPEGKEYKMKLLTVATTYPNDPLEPIKLKENEANKPKEKPESPETPSLDPATTPSNK